jgi:hypothetical protein
LASSSKKAFRPRHKRSTQYQEVLNGNTDLAKGI